MDEDEAEIVSNFLEDLTNISVYEIYDEDSALKQAKKKALELAWATSKDFLRSHIKFHVSERLMKEIVTLQCTFAEEINDLILSLISDTDKFAHDMVITDGIEHFLSDDNTEHTVSVKDRIFYCYRVETAH